MWKFESKRNDLEILNYSIPTSFAFLNKQIIFLLKPLGVSDEVIFFTIPKLKNSKIINKLF